MKNRNENRMWQYETNEYTHLVQVLSANLRRWREEAALTQHEAATRCAMATRCYQRCESAEANVTFATLAKLRAGTGLLAAQLLEGG